MLRKQTEIKRRKNFRGSLRDVFSKTFTTPRRKSRTLTDDIQYYLNDGTHPNQVISVFKEILFAKYLNFVVPCCQFQIIFKIPV